MLSLRLFPAAVLVTVAAAMLACSPDATTPDVPIADSLTLSDSAITFRALGDADTITAAAFLADSQVADAPVTWSTSNPAVATVSDSGVVTATGIGTATITAVAGADSIQATVTVDPFVALARGNGNGSCGVVASGSTWCWALPPGAAPQKPSRLQTVVEFATLYSGDNRMCGLTAPGVAYCWGINDHGAIGDGTFVTPAGPVPVAGGLTFTELAIQRPVGFSAPHVCGIAADSTAYCWGGASSGQLGIGDPDSAAISDCQVGEFTQRCATTPQKVLGGLKFVSIATGSGYTCAVAADAHMYCWGGGSGALTGNGADVPLQVLPELTFDQVSALFQHTCGRTAAGWYCWGANLSGRLGSGSTPETVGPAHKVASGSLILEEVSTGIAHTCSLSDVGAAWCWGSNGSGQLGAVGMSQSNTPSLVSSELQFTAISAGSASCGLAATGAVYCWGNNVFAPTRVPDPD